MKPKNKPRRRGRPPKGEFSNKKATLTTRITEKVRKGLDREVKRNETSLSQEVERRLSESLAAPKKADRAYGNDRNRALAFLVARLAETIESSTDKSWREDPYTCEALRAGFEILMARYAPEGKLKVPERIAKDIARRPKVYEQYKRPEGMGAGVALGLIDSVMSHDTPPLGHPPNQHYADGFYQFPLVRMAFGLEKETKK